MAREAWGSRYVVVHGVDTRWVAAERPALRVLQSTPHVYVVRTGGHSLGQLLGRT